MTLAYPFCASPLVPAKPVHRGWKWSRLTALARLATGHTPSRRRPEYWDGTIPWLQLPDIRAVDGRRVSDTLEHVSELGIENSAAVLLPANTVCMSRTASVGFVTILHRPMATSQDFVNWVCGPDLHPEFLMRLLMAARAPIVELGSGAVHKTIYFPTVESFSICAPTDIEEQRRIASGVSDRVHRAETIIERCREQLAAAECLPAAYLRSAFLGDL
jgi:type I restriction modification DNA specificity protein